MSSDRDLPPVPPPSEADPVGWQNSNWAGPPDRPPTIATAGPTGPPTVGPPPAPPGHSAPDPAAAPWWSEPAPPPEPDRREGLWLALSVGAAALLVVAAYFVFIWPGNDDESATDVSVQTEGEAGVSPEDEVGQAEPGATPEDELLPAPDETESDESESEDTESTDPTDESGVDHLECPSDVSEVICSAAAFVESELGRPFLSFPDVNVVDESTFVDRLLADVDGENEDSAVATEVWRSLGFISPEEDLWEISLTMLEVSTVGVYFADTDELYVLGSPTISEDGFDLYTQSTIVHELVHAHDDQWFNLDRPGYEEATDEVASGFSAVVEGNAIRVEEAWVAQLTLEQERELTELEGSVLDADDLDVLRSLPPLLLQLQLAPYLNGPVFVEYLVENGGQEALNEAIVSPPRYSEEFLHPEQYGDHTVIEVPTPPVPDDPAVGEVFEEWLVGELAFQLWLGPSAGDGWGGDSAITWRQEGGACTRVDAVGDNDDETEELVDAAQRWAATAERGAGERSVELLPDGPDGRLMMRLTSCYVNG